LERIKTGISGLDNILGGFPVGRSILLTGDAGSGKTIFGLSFAKSCCEQNLKTVYVTSEEDNLDLENQSKSFGWNIRDFEDSGILTIIELTGIRARVTEAEMSLDIDVMKGNITKLTKDLPKESQILILDSLGSHTARLSSYEFRNQLDLFVYELKKKNITSIIILDSATSKEFNELALFSVYGAIRLTRRENPYTGRRERIIDVVKMRSTKTPTQYLIYEINSNGIEIISATKNTDLKI
jgi:KaiC/GvpD/RAD55 family RecA-like ATPase